MLERQKPIPQLVVELRDLVVLYVRQQTLVPLKALGRYVALGLAGAFLMGLGVVFVTLAALRALQTTSDVFDGNWTWVPYLFVVIALAIGAAVTWKARGMTKAKQS
ncbi:MAG TPA: hypothetical protein VFF40_00715 [Acidimicrobiia bacterium]|nr:hypothetical protein [Acidimicrobiia bacterium]